MGNQQDFMLVKCIYSITFEAPLFYEMYRALQRIPGPAKKFGLCDGAE